MFTAGPAQTKVYGLDRAAEAFGRQRSSPAIDSAASPGPAERGSLLGSAWHPTLGKMSPRAKVSRSSSATAKVSVTIDQDALAWIAKLAKRQRKTLSSTVTEAIQSYRRDQARARVLVHLGEAGALTDEARARIDAEWD